MKKTILLIMVLAFSLGLATIAPGQLPVGWQSEDVGDPNLPGSTSYNGRSSVFSIKGGGSDTRDTWDQFHYVYQHRRGDFMVTAKVQSMDQPDTSDKAGIMIRETLDGFSKHAMVVLIPENGVGFLRRLETGGNSFHTAGSAVTAPYWVRLVRKGNTLTGYESNDGVIWIEVGSEFIAMGSEVFCGLVVMSQNSDTPCTATFGSVSIDCMPRLVAYWNFDEGHGLIAHDTSCHGIDGTLNGDPQWKEGPTGLGTALDFDGDGDLVDCGNDPIFNLTNQITVAAWVKIRTVSEDWTSIVNKGLTAWRLETLYDTRRMHFAVTDEHYVDSDADIPAGEWHHVCGTYDGADIRLYIDGEQDPGSPAAYRGEIGTNTNNLFIGRYSHSLSPRAWDGLIDEVRIYDYALSADEIVELLCVDPPPGDLDRNCMVDFSDFAIFASNWLACTFPWEHMRR
jgi:regulation of enolase protein 1 (concanavalin A-like superfamily)